MNERDSHFAGFAHLLYEDFLQLALEDEASVREMLYGADYLDRWRAKVEQCIARRAFDLVTHAFNDFFGDGCVELTENVKGEGALFAASTPDLTEWPKEGQ